MPDLVPARILRTLFDERHQPTRFPTERERERQDLIIAAGRSGFADHGFRNVNLTNFARSLRMSPATFRQHFCDLESLLAEILSTHLKAVADAVAKVANDAPDRDPLRRAAYLRATRTGMGGYTEAHLLLIEERSNLPLDLRLPIEEFRAAIGSILGGEHGHTMLHLLDSPDPHGPAVQAALAAIDRATRRADPQTLRPSPHQAPRPPQALKPILAAPAELENALPNGSLPNWPLPSPAPAFQATAGPN